MYKHRPRLAGIVELFALLASKISNNNTVSSEHEIYGELIAVPSGARGQKPRSSGFQSDPSNRF